MTIQTFICAGTSTNAKGIHKARFGNDLVGRVKKLNDNTNMNLVSLPSAMTKQAAATYLLDLDAFSSVVDREALSKVVFRNVPKRKVATVTNTPVNIEAAVVV
tara:strand:+ start:322 stop:630 length:309 start_codon:yes stop_codon:yes gene_type:complete